MSDGRLSYVGKLWVSERPRTTFPRETSEEQIYLFLKTNNIC